MAPIDDGTAVHYTAVPKGVPVYSADEQAVGTLVEVLDNYREHIMDGVVFDDPEGVRRFADEEVFVEDERCFFTMELVKGQPLDEYVRALEPRRLEAAQMGAAADRARHQAGVLQHPHMFRCAGEAHLEWSRQFPDRELPLGQMTKHRPARRVR